MIVVAYARSVMSSCHLDGWWLLYVSPHHQSSFVTRSVRVFQTKPNAELLWSRTMPKHNSTHNAPPQRTYEHSNTAVEKRIPTTVQKVSAE